jgi:hypothetical protein
MRKGSVPEVVADGETGFVVDTLDEMIDAVGPVDEIDRERVAELFSVETMADGYEQLYGRIGQLSTDQTRAMEDPDGLISGDRATSRGDPELDRSGQLLEMALARVLRRPLPIAGWSGRGWQGSGASDVVKESSQPIGWRLLRPVIPVDGEPRPGAEPGAHPPQRLVPDDPSTA